jgi:hypothetical protein
LVSAEWQMVQFSRKRGRIYFSKNSTPEIKSSAMAGAVEPKRRKGRSSRTVMELVSFAEGPRAIFDEWVAEKRWPEVNARVVSF